MSLAFSSVAFAEGGAVLSLTPFEAKPGETFTTTLFLKENSQLIDFQARFLYDRDSVQLVGTANERDGMAVAANAAGQISMRFSRTSGNLTANTNLVELTFKVDENIGIGSEALLKVDPSYAFEAHTLAGGDFAPLPLSADFQKLSIYETGDVNLDSRISTTDVNYLRQHLAGIRALTPYQLYHADANADGSISISDAVRVQQRIDDPDMPLGDRLNITFYDRDGGVYATKSVRIGADLLTVPAAPAVAGFSNGRWSASADGDVAPVFTGIVSGMKLYPVYDEDESDDMKYYKERLELWYGKPALNGVLGGDLFLRESIPYGSKHADIYWSINNDAVLQFDKNAVVDQWGKFSRPTYDSVVSLTATIVPFDSTNTPQAQGTMTFPLSVKGVFVTPAKAEIAAYLHTAVRQQIDSNMKLPRKVTNAEVNNPSPYEVRVEWTQVGADGTERPATYISRGTTSIVVDLVATVTFNGEPLEDDGRVYFDGVVLLPISESEIRTHIINSVAGSLGRSISNGTSLWNDDQAFGANLAWRSKKTDDAVIENNVMQIMPTAINGTILPMEVDVTYPVDDDGFNNGANTFKLSYNIELINNSVILVPGVNIDPELHRALKAATGTSGTLVTAALNDVKFVYLDLSGYPDIADLTGLAYCVNLRVLNISGLRVERGVNEISTLNSLEALIARDCGLDNLTDGGAPVLKTAINLKLLDLSHNSFTSLNSVFAPNVRYGKLSEVYLNGNSLQDISALQSAPTLRLLAMSDNGLGDEDLEAFVNFKYLMYLSLANNNISNITPLKGLTNLVELRLHDNQIASVRDLQLLQNLQALYLGNNKISDVTWLNNLRQLRVLYLNGNSLSDVSGLGALNKLTAVNVSGNSLQSLYALTASAGTMTELYAEGNAIPSFSFIANMTGLRRLMLSNNQYTYEPSLIDNLGRLTQLRTLTVSGKDLRGLGFLGNMPLLTRLDAASCNLPADSASHLPIALRYLDVSNNGLAYAQGSTSGIYELDQLIGFYADNMQGDVDPAQLMTLMTQLRFVSLENCGVSSTSWISKFNKIVFVDLAKNPISNFDFNTIRSGRETLEYLYLDSNAAGSFADAYYAYSGAGESPMRELSLGNLQVLDMKNLPDLENVACLDLSNTGITALRGTDPDFAELYSIERYQTVETLDITGLQAAIAPVENLPKLTTLYAVGAGEDRIFYRDNILSLYRLHSKGVTAFLYGREEAYEPVARREGAVILGQLPDISRTVTVAADNAFSDNNPELAASINDFPITWAVSNPVNYKIEAGKLSVASYGNLVDEELTLTAKISVYPDQGDVSREFKIQANILRASDAYISRVEPGDAYMRGEQFVYDVTVGAALVDGSGFSLPVKPVYTEIRYAYSGSQPWTQILAESAGHSYLVKETAALGSTVDIGVAIGHNAPGLGFVADWTNPGTRIEVVSRRNLLTYHLNGGAAPGISDGNPISKAEEAAIADFTPDRPGYLFEGWFEDAAFAVPFLLDRMPPRDLHLYAKWKEHSYTVTFDPNGGTAPSDSKLVYCGGTYGELPVPSLDYFDFVGWFTAKSGGSQKTPDTAANAAPAPETLYARWQRRTFDLSFNANGGSVSPAGKTVNCGDPYGALPTPALDYNNFLGWFTAASGGSLVNSATAADNTTDAKTVYAHWELKPVSGWALASSVPSGAQAVERKWTYSHTQSSSSSSTPSGYYYVSTAYGAWGGWGGWQTASIAKQYNPFHPNDGSHLLRDVGERWVSEAGHTEWHYYRWTNGSSCWSYKYGSGYWLEEIWLTWELPVYNNGSLGVEVRVNGSGAKNIWIVANYAYNRDTDKTWTRWVVDVSAHTEYQSRTRTATYTYRKDNIEVTANPSGGSGVSNVVEYVRYREK
jgi:uncharacterized repeat protein (TIGR02543 family)